MHEYVRFQTIYKNIQNRAKAITNTADSPEPRNSQLFTLTITNCHVNHKDPILQHSTTIPHTNKAITIGK